MIFRDTSPSRYSCHRGLRHGWFGGIFNDLQWWLANANTLGKNPRMIWIRPSLGFPSTNTQATPEMILVLMPQRVQEQDTSTTTRNNPHQGPSKGAFGCFLCAPWHTKQPAPRTYALRNQQRTPRTQPRAKNWVKINYFRGGCLCLPSPPSKARVGPFYTLFCDTVR